MKKSHSIGVPLLFLCLFVCSFNSIAADSFHQPWKQHVTFPQYLLFPGRDFLYFSQDRGTSWERLDPKVEISDATYISAAAINPLDPGHFVLGTSYHGLFESHDGGRTWADMDPHSTLDEIYQGAGFYNEISGLVFSKDGKNLFVRTAFDDKIYLLEIESNNLEYLTESGEAVAAHLKSHIDTVSTEDIAFFESLIVAGEPWPAGHPKPAEYLSDNQLPASFIRDPAWVDRRGEASDKVGIYINAYQIANRTEEFLSYVKSMGFNSVVIDFKDDQGLLRYLSTVPVAAEVGSVKPLFSAEEIIRRFHSEGIYVIARVVVFKDRALYRYDNNRYALWDKRLKEPWGVYRSYESKPTEDNPNPPPRIEQVEYWVDPYSEFVRNYNIQIAQELESLGVDEIQFDYIRFPSDGRTKDIVTRYLNDGNGELSDVDKNSQRVRILATFLSEARRNISIPIGTDVFGFNAWARMSYLGQDIEVMSHYVDVISPMSYPSHYPRNFYNEMTYLDKAQHIYEEGTRRARKITNDRVIIRQYVQAFLIGGELNFEEDTFFPYLNRQLDGTVQGGGSGFTLWNNSGRYYMVSERTISEYVKPVTEAFPTEVGE